MNMRKIYKEGLALGLSPAGLRRWCIDILDNGPEDKKVDALEILKILDAHDAKYKKEEDPLDRGLSKLRDK